MHYCARNFNPVLAQPSEDVAPNRCTFMPQLLGSVSWLSSHHNNYNTDNTDALHSPCRNCWNVLQCHTSARGVVDGIWWHKTPVRAFVIGLFLSAGDRSINDTDQCLAEQSKTTQTLPGFFEFFFRMINPVACYVPHLAFVYRAVCQFCFAICNLSFTNSFWS